MLQVIASHASDICAIVTLVVLIVKPVRERLFSTEQIREGQRCLLRSEIVRIYYRHLEDTVLHEYEYKNLCHCYKAYKQLKGNSFIDHIYEEMQEWKVIQ